MATRRIERINERIKQIVSTAVLYEMKDPRVGFCTITRVETAPDLKSAKVYVSVMGREVDERKTMRALGHARGHLQGKVAEGLGTRFSPVIRFVRDTSVKASIRISEILRNDREG